MLWLSVEKELYLFSWTAYTFRCGWKWLNCIVFKRECVGNLNNREIYADKIYSDLSFYEETQECKKLELFIPIKAIKGESPEITKREKAAKELFSMAVSKVRHPIESLFNWLWKNKYSKSDESQIYIWTFSTYDGKNCHRIHLSNFLKQESEINYWFALLIIILFIA